MKRKLRFYGDPILRVKCREVTEITEEIKQLAQDLIDTVKKEQGSGLAAPQIGVDLQVFVGCYHETDKEGWPILGEPKVYINPKLSEPSKETMIHDEGCLSIPGIYAPVERPVEITLEALTLEGKKIKERVKLWRARNIMHENDHVNGVLFIDRLKPKHKKLITQSLQRLKKKYKS